MSTLNCCPNPSCGRKAEKSFFFNHFIVHTCRKCGKKYCNKCGKGTGTTCPKCGSNEYSDYDKVYA